MSSKQNKTTRFKNATALSLEEELKLADEISQGVDFIGQDNITQEQKELAEKALEASHQLIESYSYLIETIATERYAQAGAYSDLDEFISEAYIIALQCALKFNPHASKRGIIRFSSYAPRAISSSLKRIIMKSRSMVSVPVSKMSDARAWSHTKFDLANKGVEADDETVSAISGIDMTENDAQNILMLSEGETIDDIFPPSITDSHQVVSPQDALIEILEELDNDFWSDKSSIIKRIIGIDNGKIAMKASDLSRYKDTTKEEAIEQIQEFTAIMNHPITRMRFKNSLDK